MSNPDEYFFGEFPSVTEDDLAGMQRQAVASDLGELCSAIEECIDKARYYDRPITIDHLEEYLRIAKRAMRTLE